MQVGVRPVPRDLARDALERDGGGRAHACVREKAEPQAEGRADQQKGEGLHLCTEAVAREPVMRASGGAAAGGAAPVALCCA